MAEPRTVVITGGGTGIGKASAMSFARSGDQVIIVGRREGILEAAAGEILASTGTPVRFRVCDVTEPDDVDALGAWLDSTGLTPVDVLVNNAGAADLGVIETTADAAAQARAVLNANLMSLILTVHVLRPRLRRPGGRVVTISSVAAFRGGNLRYSAAKAGMVGFSYALAKELGPEGITVNVICPGLILGTDYFGESRERLSLEREQSLVAGNLVGRAGQPDDVAAAVAYLASPDAGYVTGEVLHVNGGSLFGR